MGLDSKSNTGEGAQAVETPTNKSMVGRPLILIISIFLYRIELARSEHGDTCLSFHFLYLARL